MLVASACAEQALRSFCYASGPAAPCVPDLVTAQAMRRPYAVAVADGSRVLTYDQLDCQANRLAHRLRSLGVGAGTPVGLSLLQPLETVIGALGILKAGGACVPMDPAYPSDQETSVKVAALDQSQLSECDYPPKVHSMANDVAFVLRGLCSTGEPRRVEIAHADLSKLLAWHRHAFAVTPADRAAQIGGGSDAAALELWPYLTAGASVHLADQSLACSPEFLRDWLLEQKITICSVPARIAERLVLLEWPQQTPLGVLLTGGGTFAHEPPPGLPFRFIDGYEPIKWMAELEPVN